MPCQDYWSPGIKASVPGRASSRRAEHHQPRRPNWCGGHRGPAAVPVGGGRAWPGFEIDHSERSSRVAISRAGRRPPAHTEARPNKAGHAAAGDLSGQRTTRSRPAPQGPGGSHVRPLGDHQRRVQRIWVPVRHRPMITQRFRPARRAGSAIR